MSTSSDDPDDTADTADTARAASSDGHSFPPPGPPGAPPPAPPQLSAAAGSAPWTSPRPDRDLPVNDRSVNDQSVNDQSVNDQSFADEPVSEEPISEEPILEEPEHVVPYGTRAGDVTPRWRVVLAAAWIIAFFAYAAIWQASVQIGIATWWIGPRAQPTHTVVRILPSVLTITMAMCVIYNVPRLLRVSAIGVGLATLIAIPDFSRSTGLGVVEVLVAGLLGLVTVAALSGRYRPAPAPDALDTDGSTEGVIGTLGSHDTVAPTGPPPFPTADGTRPASGIADGTANRRSDDDADHRAAMASFAPPDPKGH